ncbi:hypothetical protein [Sulfolobus acidocaldarius]|uniref:Conserved protein n=4 Tax=Sulfolobus acidocaldarius TaxID=2285 RepID=Q4JCH5_SULAC|nr:hypothetical protein [Sulfolobus acidocaldarius]AAY79504.1 conserved protein [Sulfolobus acidocaldarius DSM 639]AGE70053.1 hypothetical protein SacN8_00360 [Sulfolobus acidocaldarius N8]AGE72328.1 hypothetical protein SacRon12I_00360 [Sulfolobus acidocaldarius Ron12/I]ALU29521.1 hypothetical protein ATY89_05885 [Sulfolobus acidocaldarius]ALU32251.1 hypothetical protein ATZ20_08910 [Sulfolobus acidocaldarius]
MPPAYFSIFEKLGYCNNSSCVEKIVDEYLKSIINTSTRIDVSELSKTNNQVKFAFTDDDEEEMDEKEFFNFYKFTEALVEKIIQNEIDVDLIVYDLEEKLGKSHPIVIFLKQIIDE